MRLDRLNVAVGEVLAAHVEDARARVAAQHRVADGLEEVRLAEPDVAVDKQRVVGVAGVLTDRKRGCVREAVYSSPVWGRTITELREIKAPAYIRWSTLMQEGTLFHFTPKGDDNCKVQIALKNARKP